MRLLLDTHTFLWFVLNDASLSGSAKALIEDSTNTILVSPASYWGIAIKVRLGKLDLLREAQLDGLNDGLMGAITDAVRDGARLAVKDAIVEILTDPALRARLQQAVAAEPVAPAAPAESKPSFWSRFKNAAASAVGAVTRAVNRVVRKGRQVTTAVVAVVRDPMRALRWLGNFKRLLVLGARVGPSVATLSLFAPHLASALVSGIAGGVAAVAVQVSLWTRRAVHVLAMA